MSIREKILREREALGLIMSWSVMAEGLRAEVIEGLRFLLESDIKIYSYIGQGSIEAFQVQEVEFPSLLVEYVK